MLRRLIAALLGPFAPKSDQLRIPPEIFELAHAQRPSWPRLSAVAAAQGPVNDGTKTAEEKDLEEKIDKARNELVDFLKEKEHADPDPLDKSELEKREKELGEKVDRIFELAKGRESDEVAEFREKLEKLEEHLEKIAKSPAADPKSTTAPSHGRASGEFDRLKSYRELEIETAGSEDKFAIQEAREANVFLDMKRAAKGDRAASERLARMNDQIGGDTGLRMKAWATGDLEDVDLVMPDIQEALPYLRAEQRVVSLFRELRTTSPAVEFPRFLSGLDVGHHDDQAANPADKVESDPEFDLLLARVYTIAGTTRIPNSTLEDFPAARAWIATELGRATGIQEAIDVLEGDGTGEPTGLFRNGDIPRIGLTQNTGRGIINAAFRAAQDVRFNGHVEPSDIVMAPPVWTDVVLSFETNIGYLYGPPQGDGAAWADVPKPRILGLPVTQEPYITDAYGSDGSDYPFVVGQFMDGIVIRRSPFRVDVDTSLGFLKNQTYFRGEERMGFVVVRPISFEIVEGATGGQSE